MRGEVNKEMRQEDCYWCIVGYICGSWIEIGQCFKTRFVLLPAKLNLSPEL